MGSWTGIEKFIFIDVYDFLEEYIIYDKLSDKQWDMVVDRARAIAKKYDNHPMAVRMSVEVIYELELKNGKHKTSDNKSYHDYDNTLRNVLNHRYSAGTQCNKVINDKNKDMSREDKLRYWFK